MPPSSRSAAACIALACVAFLAPAAAASTPSDERVVTGSVRLPDAGGLTLGSARIVRALTADEWAAPMEFSVSLRMRDFAGLDARLARGEQVSAAEMDATYLPLPGDYARLAAWLAARGFTATLRDRTRISVFVRGSVSAVAAAFGVPFARVAVSDGEYSSALSEPSVPADLAPSVLSVNGLQPEFRLRHVKVGRLPEPADIASDGRVYATPDNVASAYRIPSGATGAGQTIAIVGEAPLPMADLSDFWSATNVAQVAGNVTTVNTNGGPDPNPDESLIFEADLDVEWAGAMAPAAQIRYYASRNALQSFVQVLDDVPSFPSMRVVSTSFGFAEADEGSGTLTTFAQYAANFSAAGVSILAASGDAGSNPNGGSSAAGSYLASAPLSVGYPASDPNVTGVGGTTVAYTGKWAYAGEIVWDDISDAMSPSASGGGVSGFYPKPSWQTGGSVLAGQTTRCVPDVAAISTVSAQNLDLGSGFSPFSDTEFGVLIYENGTPSGAIGTSLAAPVWAGVTALINQARASSGMGSIGLLNPHLYPLAGTSAFNDVTSGNNGAYTAGPGYDLCTGLGSPNVANLIAALSSQGPRKRLINISARAEVETGANIVIAGFVIQGPAGTSKNVLVRGIGPALAAFNVSGTLANPVVGVYDSAAAPLLIATNTGWGNPPTAGSSKVAATFRQATAADMQSVGAFALAAGSTDSAMVLTLPTGGYTVQVSGVNASSGVALTEVYELDTASADFLGNISARCFVGTGSAVAISGFVVEGSQQAQLLVRGIGPALAAFGLTGTLANPTISIFDPNSVQVAANTGWGNAPTAGTSKVAASFRQATAADMQSVGAFALTAGSNDSAIVVTLPPGAYTAVISGVNATTGTALVEVYQMAGP
ncbi:MAG TPA: S53 family peptidase [Opitutaceae bacterium]